MAPRSAAASVGRKLVAPVIAAITQSAGRDAASTTASSPAPALDPGARERLFQIAMQRRVRDRRKTRADLARNCCERRDIAMRGDRLDTIAAALLFKEIDRRGADRAGGAEDADRTDRRLGGGP